MADLLVNLRLSQFLVQEYKLFKTDPWEDTNGTIGAPDSNEYIFGEKTNRAETGYDFEVPDYLLHHLSAQYMLDDAWSVTFGVRNVADETPPVISAGFYSRVGNSPLGSGYGYVDREYFASMAYSF